MSQLFISHSSLDNAQAIALRDWLREQGWSLFLDLDPESGIQVGEEWRKKLHYSINECEAILLLISDNWLTSLHCLSEYQTAVFLNKPIFPLVIGKVEEQIIPQEILDKWNIGDLTLGYPKLDISITLPNGTSQVVAFSQLGLNSLKSGLTLADLHPECFQWPPLSRYHNPPSPYKGLKPLEQEDAGILFGRDGAIKALMSELHRLRNSTKIRVIAIQGASGAGKSSFLRAGILPRLARYPQHFIVLPVIRPYDAVLTGEKGLIESFVQYNYQHKLGYTKQQITALVKNLYNNEDISETSLNPEAVSTFKLFLNHIINANNSIAFLNNNGETPQSATLILPLDQAEELFTENNKEANPFLLLIAELIRSNEIDLMIVSTIRTDAYSLLQAAKKLEGIHQYPFSLPRIAKGAYQQIIEGPAKLLAKTQKPLWIDPQLTDQLLKDLEQDGGKDALPLLAFTLERLYLDYGYDGKLELKEYLTFQDDSTQQHSGLGGLQGAVNIAIDEALRKARQDPRIPQEHNACMQLLRRAFIPYLASIDLKTHNPHRKIAHYRDIPEDARPLIDSLVESRLLTKDYCTQLSKEEKELIGNGKPSEHFITIELAHESILRQWHLLSDWLKEDIADLSLLEMLQVETTAWVKSKKHPEWLRLRGGRLQAATQLQQGKFKHYISKEQQNYLQSCYLQEVQDQEDELNKAKALSQARATALKHTKLGLIFSSALLSLSIFAGLFAFEKKQEAEQQTIKYQMELEKSKILLKEIGSAVRFLNFDLRDVLEQYVPTTKQTAIYEQIEHLRENLEHYSNQKKSRQVATAYINQGNHAWSLGDLEKAGRYYQRAFKEFKILAEQAPEDPKAQQDLSVAYEKLGNIAEMQQNFRQALSNYQSSFNIRQQLPELTPENRTAQRSLSIAYKKLGNIYYLRNQSKAALHNYRASLEIDEKLSKLQPEDDGTLRELSISYHNLGNLMYAEHKYSQALSYYQMAFDLSKEWAKRDPINQKAMQDLSVAYERLGDVKYAQNEYENALLYYQKAIEIDKKQAEQDPNDPNLQRNLGFSYEKIGNINRLQKRSDQALENYHSALDIFQKLANNQPSSRQAQRSLGIAYDKLGNIAIEKNELKQAERYYKQAFHIFQKLAKKSPKNRQIQRIFSIAHNKLGLVEQGKKNYAKALEHFQAGFSIRYKLYLKNVNNRTSQQDIASSYELLGDVAKVQQNYSQALYYYQQALSFSEMLLKEQPENTSLFENTTYLHQKLSAVYQDLQDNKNMLFHHDEYQKLRAQLK